MIPKTDRAEQQHPAVSSKKKRPAKATILPIGGVIMDDSRLIERGVRLFRHLVELADQGQSVGVGYAQFACWVHGVETFQDIFHRPYQRQDTKYVLGLAKRITTKDGRKHLGKNGAALEAGMDTFIWRSEFPHDRPSKAFKSTPYSEETWKKVFPDGTRRLLKRDEISKLL